MKGMYLRELVEVDLEVDRLVDEQVLAVVQARLHARALDAEVLRHGAHGEEDQRRQDQRLDQLERQSPAAVPRRDRAPSSAPYSYLPVSCGRSISGGCSAGSTGGQSASLSFIDVTRPFPWLAPFACSRARRE